MLREHEIIMLNGAGLGWLFRWGRFNWKLSKDGCIVTLCIISYEMNTENGRINIAEGRIVSRVESSDWPFYIRLKRPSLKRVMKLPFSAAQKKQRLSSSGLVIQIDKEDIATFTFSICLVKNCLAPIWPFPFNLFFSFFFYTICLCGTSSFMIIINLYFKNKLVQRNFQIFKYIKIF